MQPIYAGTFTLFNKWTDELCLKSAPLKGLEVLMFLVLP